MSNPTIYITPETYEKIWSLTDKLTTEVGGYLEIRGNVIVDVHVPPQTVTSTSVDIDAKELVKWMSSLDPEVDQYIRGIWHSHAYMGTHDSVIDDDFKETWLSILDQLPYVVSLITNRRGEYGCSVTYFKPVQCTVKCDVKVLLPEIDVSKWVQEQLPKIKELVPRVKYKKGKKSKKRKSSYYKSKGDALDTYNDYGLFDDEWDWSYLRGGIY